MDLRRHFTEHPASVGETYGQHLKVAASFAGLLAKATAACAVHALIPSLCTRTASGTIDELHTRMHAARRGDLRPVRSDAPEAA